MVRLADLPAPPPGKVGWPWTEEGPPVPEAMPPGGAWPRISIVTPSYNQGQFIEETIRSILLQGYPNLEYIVIDGGSQDESVEIIRKYEPWLSHWESKPDRGQPHAINKGLALASGPIFNWINSDDFLSPSALFEIAAAFGSRDAVAGSILYFGPDGATVGLNAPLLPERIIRDGGKDFQQPAIWMRRDHVLGCGGIDEQLHYAFDWDLAIRYFYLYPKVTYLPSVLVHFRLHEASKTVSTHERFGQEVTAILRKLLTLEQFKALHPICKRTLPLRETYRLIDHARRTNPRRPLRHLTRLALRNPQVCRTRFFWGSVRQVLQGGAAARN